MLRPIRDQVLIEELKSEGVSQGGIILPENAKKGAVRRGRVVAIGTGRTTNEGVLMPLAVSINDVVLYHEHGPTTLTIEGKEFKIMPESEILVIEG